MNSLPTNGYETSPPSGVSPRVRRLAPIIVPIAILALAGAGFLAYRLDSSTPVVSSSVLLAPSVISGGDGHTCALISRGKVECWGENGSYELGNGTNTDSSTPVKVSDITNAIEVSAGGLHTCALISGGTVECWGDNQDGDLGNGSTNGGSTPVRVSGVTNAIQVSSGYDGACALLSRGTIKCWGRNDFGELGVEVREGYGNESSTPVQISGITNAIQVSAGIEQTCALISGGSVECWGADFLGNSRTKGNPTPVQVPDITNAIEVSAGGGACALISGGKVECWPPGMIGSTAKSTTPIQVPGITNAIQISIGGSPCALLSGGKIECWGPNNTGQLGNGTTKSHSTPVAVSNITDATQVAANTGFACALLTSRKVECWGDNWYGQLGNGTAGGEWWIPVTVVGIP
jgi:alpha-tubulin suppressor-like RCC1 family protein